MNPWGPLAGTLAWNFWRHKRGKPTICSTTRRFIPKPLAYVLFCVGVAGLAVHFFDAYDIKLDLSDLT